MTHINRPRKAYFNICHSILTFTFHCFQMVQFTLASCKGKIKPSAYSNWKPATDEYVSCQDMNSNTLKRIRKPLERFFSSDYFKNVLPTLTSFNFSKNADIKDGPKTCWNRRILVLQTFFAFTFCLTKLSENHNYLSKWTFALSLCLSTDIYIKLENRCFFLSLNRLSAIKMGLDIKFIPDQWT